MRVDITVVVSEDSGYDRQAVRRVMMVEAESEEVLRGQVCNTTAVGASVSSMAHEAITERVRVMEEDAAES